jgi:subtilase family serine protease
MNHEKEEVYPVTESRRWQPIALCALITLLIAGLAVSASAATGQYIAHNTPRYVTTAKNLGTENPSKVIEVSIWLQPHNRTQMDALAAEVYNRNSPNFRKFLTPAQIGARFAPTAAEAKTVQQFFESHNLKVVRTGANNFFVRARGTVADVQTAFHVTLNNYQVGSKVIRSNDRDPYVDGDAATLVSSIAGLENGRYDHPMKARPTMPGNKAMAAALKTTSTPGTASNFYTNNCFDGTEKETYSTNNDGEYPIATFSGNHLNLQTTTAPGCAYTPTEIQTAYNLTGLYKEGFDGSGQTIGIIDWCGSSTIQADANAFSTQFGLPQLTSDNFSIIYTPTPSLCIAPDQVEINIDVEWAHAVAPGANIALIVPPSASFLDVDESEFNAINYGWANVISGSYGSVEAFTPATILATENLINEIGALSGISANFATGDDGDYTIFGIPPSVNAPADSPWATAVGGVSLALNSDNSIAWQAGWGNNESLISETGFIFDPPLAFGFNGGAGGGASGCATQDSDGDCLAGFPKPSFQKGVPGKYRQVPDIGWLADPFTGAVIAISVPGQVPEVVYQVWGGTSLATPMFAGLWAIANQEAQSAGGPPLGFAAPYLYNLPAGAITDIVPVSSKTNVFDKVQESATESTPYSAATVAGVSSGKFISAIWDYPSEFQTAVVISFGTDSSLTTGPGWDNVTGVGVPNAQAFADSFAPAAAVKK